MRVYFVRHGHSVSNSGEDRDSRQGGDALTDLGWEQARKLGRRLAGGNFAAIYVSPLQRAQETAAAMAETIDAPLIIHPGIHEIIRPGSSYDPTMTDDEHWTNFREHWKRMMTKPAEESHEDAESFAEIRGRAAKFLDELASRSDRHSVLVVTHGNFLRFLLGIVLRGDAFGPADVTNMMRIKSANTGISIFEHVGAGEDFYSGWQLVTWMDQSHL